MLGSWLLASYKCVPDLICPLRLRRTNRDIPQATICQHPLLGRACSQPWVCSRGWREGTSLPRAVPSCVHSAVFVEAALYLPAQPWLSHPPHIPEEKNLSSHVLSEGATRQGYWEEIHGVHKDLHQHRAGMFSPCLCRSFTSEPQHMPAGRGALLFLSATSQFPHSSLEPNGLFWL